MMKKNFHPPTQIVKFHCSSCQSAFKILSTIQQKEVTIEVCSGCHPYYLGKSNVIRVTGKAERLIGKFDTGKKVANKEIKTTKVRKPAKKQAKVKQSLSHVPL